MTKNRWCKFFPSDFLKGVRNLTSIEVAAYIIVLCELYDNEGMVRRDDEHFARACLIRRVTDFSRALDGLIAKGKIDVVDGFLTNKRVTEEIEKRTASAAERARSRNDLASISSRSRISTSKKTNEIKGKSADVRAYIESRDKNTSSLDVGALYSPSEPISAEEASKRALEGFRARQRRRQDRFH